MIEAAAEFALRGAMSPDGNLKLISEFPGRAFVVAIGQDDAGWLARCA